MEIENFGKGCVPVPDHIKAGHFKLALGAVTPVDWTVSYMVESGFVLPQRNQNGSSSCTAQSTSYYCEALDKQHDAYSARYTYSQSHLSGGGAYISQAMSIPVSKGLATLASVPEGDESEGVMIDPTLNSHAILIDKAEKYAQITNTHDMDYLAGLVKQYGGFVTGFNGKNDMFSPDGTASVFSGPADWGHAVWVCGYELRNGVKCLKFKNSWGSGWGTNGYGFFPEQFVKSGIMFDAYVYADVADLNTLVTQDQLNKIYEGFFKRPVDAGGISAWVGKDLDVVLDGLLSSKENQEYILLFQAGKKIENDVRSGQF